jgi:HAMP domain-containing protein
MYRKRKLAEIRMKLSNPLYEVNILILSVLCGLFMNIPSLEIIMKKRILLPICIILLLVPSLFAAKVEKVYKVKDNCCNCLDDVDIDLHNDILTLTCKYDRDQWIEITADREMFISGKKVYLNRHQKRLVGDYYDHFIEILDRAKDIGKEGAKIGIEGAKVGLIAATRAIKMLSDDYDQEDFERDIEEETEELEIRAEKLEEMADELEEVAEEFEEIHYTMKSEIDELNDLDWF